MTHPDMRLVPVEPMPEMLAAFWRQKNTGSQEPGETGHDRSDYAAYRAMLAAAPHQPQPAAREEGDGEDGAWIIWFEDADREPETFVGFGARDAAQRRYDQVTVSWNAHLFERVKSALPLRAQQPADDKLAKAVDALEPFARLELPKKPVGNAGAYSILHTDIRRAKEALAALKTVAAS